MPHVDRSEIFSEKGIWICLSPLPIPVFPPPLPRWLGSEVVAVIPLLPHLILWGGDGLVQTEGAGVLSPLESSPPFLVVTLVSFPVTYA